MKKTFLCNNDESQKKTFTTCGGKSCERKKSAGSAVFNRKPIEAIAKITSSRKKEERKAAMTAIEVRPTLLLDLNLTNKPADDTTCLLGRERTKRSASWLEAMR